MGVRICGEYIWGVAYPVLICIRPSIVRPVIEIEYIVRPVIICVDHRAV